MLERHADGVTPRSRARQGAPPASIFFSSSICFFCISRKRFSACLLRSMYLVKAGTATKMVLNMITTGAMIRLGKTYGNLMVDLKATNAKLEQRSKRIVSQLTDLTFDESAELLAQCDGEVKTAIVVQRRDVEPEEARRLLAANDQHLRRALETPVPDERP